MFPFGTSRIITDETEAQAIVFGEEDQIHLGEYSKNQNLDGHFKDDVPAQKKIIANHSHIFLEGNLGENSQIRLRQGIVSLKKLERASEVFGGTLLIISDSEGSNVSKNMQRHISEYPIVIVVPEQERERVFSDMAYLATDLSNNDYYIGKYPLNNQEVREKVTAYKEAYPERILEIDPFFQRSHKPGRPTGRC